MSSACVSTIDRQEAELVGRAAVQAAVGGETGKMVTLLRSDEPGYRVMTGLAGLEQIANRHRALPAEFFDAGGKRVTQAFRDYALPLLGDPLPRPFRLNGRTVSW
jgi:6-phosphofructokinase 1